MSTRNLIALFFIFVTASPVITKVGLITNYYLKLEQYQKNCINKAKPALKCNGNCQLAKELKLTENTQPQNSQPDFPGNLFQETVSYMPEVLNFCFDQTVEQNIYYLNQLVYLSENFPLDFFHPPELHS